MSQFAVLSTLALVVVAVALALILRWVAIAELEVIEAPPRESSILRNAPMDLAAYANGGRLVRFTGFGGGKPPPGLERFGLDLIFPRAAPETASASGD